MQKRKKRVDNVGKGCYTSTMMTNVPYQLTDKTLTVVFDGKVTPISRSHPVADEIIDVLKADEIDTDLLTELLDPAGRLAERLDGTGVEIVGNTVVFRGKRIAGHLEDRILDIVDTGLDVGPWKRFVERIFNNPSSTARKELHLFLEGASLPITDDGCFLAYKRVNENYTDTYSGSISNAVGQVVTMERGEVDDERDRTCSHGLHFCSNGYLQHYYRGRGHIMILKIDPADVVSIPSDYSNTKGRCCRYEVVGEIDTDDEAQKKEWGIISYDYDGDYDFGETYWDDDEWGDDDYFDDVDDDEADEAIVTHEDHFKAPAPERQGFWRRAVGKVRRW